MLCAQRHVVHTRQGDKKDDEIGGDVHNRRCVPHRQGIETFAGHAGDDGGDRDAAKAEQDRLHNSPEQDEKEEPLAHAVGRGAAATEDASVLEEEGHLDDIICQVVGEDVGV